MRRIILFINQQVSLDCTHAIVDLYFLCKHIYVGFVCVCLCIW